jgi:hypothetical protein
MVDAVELAIMTDVDMHEGGCWTWNKPSECNVIQMLAALIGRELPEGRKKLYRMPECTMAKVCVNPQHVGTLEEFEEAVRRWKAW